MKPIIFISKIYPRGPSLKIVRNRIFPKTLLIPPAGRLRDASRIPRPADVPHAFVARFRCNYLLLVRFLKNIIIMLDHSFITKQTATKKLA